MCLCELDGAELVKCNAHLYSLSLVCKTNNRRCVCLCIHTNTQREHTRTHNMLSMEMDAGDITNIIKVHFPILLQTRRKKKKKAPHKHKQMDARTHAHTLLIQHSANEDGSHCLAGVAVFHNCKVTRLSEH